MGRNASMQVPVSDSLSYPSASSVNYYSLAVLLHALVVVADTGQHNTRTTVGPPALLRVSKQGPHSYRPQPTIKKFMKTDVVYILD